MSVTEAGAGNQAGLGIPKTRALAFPKATHRGYPGGSHPSTQGQGGIEWKYEGHWLPQSHISRLVKANASSACLSSLMAVTPLAGQGSTASLRPPHQVDGLRTADRQRSPAPNSHKRIQRGNSRPAQAARAARTARLHQAFVASTELRPMAQQLALLRTPEAYAGVTAYARKHTGEAAAAAYLALGHAYLLDKRYAEAEQYLRQARQAGEELADYADFLGAQASHESRRQCRGRGLLHGFADRYPDSIFDAQAPELEANVLLAMNNAAGAQKVLAACDRPAAEDRSGFQLAQGQVESRSGQTAGRRSGSSSSCCSAIRSRRMRRWRAPRLTEMGAEARLTAGRAAQPGRCLLQRRPLRAKQPSNTAPLLRIPALGAVRRATALPSPRPPAS